MKMLSDDVRREVREIADEAARVAISAVTFRVLSRFRAELLKLADDVRSVMVPLTDTDALVAPEASAAAAKQRAAKTAPKVLGKRLGVPVLVKPIRSAPELAVTPTSIKKLRMRLKLNRPAFARIAGVSTWTVFMWEHGKVAISDKNAARVREIAAGDYTVPKKARAGRPRKAKK